MPKWLKFTLITLVVLVLFGACASAVLGQPNVTPASSDKVTDAPAVAKIDKTAESKLSENQKQALRAAKNYQEFAHFSEQGLVDQLVSFDKFSRSDAKAAVKAGGFNWDQEAVEKAEQYLSSTGFSRQGLTRQLVTFDKFTDAQAKVGVEKAFANQ